MSRAPTGMAVDSFSPIAAAIRRASGTPRRWIPTRASPRVPACFSTISWEMRIVARRISSAVMIWRPVIAPSRASPGVKRPLGAVEKVAFRIPDGRRFPRSVDRDGDPGRARPGRAAADGEEVGRVEVDDSVPIRGDGPVVAHDTLEAAARAADDDRRATWQAHRGRTVAVEGRVAAQPVARRL